MPDPTRPLPGWPTIDDVEGPYVPTAYARPRNPHLPDVAAPDAFMAGADGQPIALYAHPPAPQASAIPASLAGPAARIDPWTQRILAAGAVSPLIGWGCSMAFGALAGASTAIAYLAGCLALAYLMRSSGGGGGGRTNVKVNVHNNTTVHGR
jgi:hypothetical protein